MKLKTTAFVAALLAMTGAQAHYLWIEQDAQGARLYYGEFDGNLREVSPGRLDTIEQPVARLIAAGADKPLTLQKASGFMSLPARTAKGESLVVDNANWAVAERIVNGQKRRYAKTLSTRYVPDATAQEPTLPLDVVPTGLSVGGGMEVQVFYKGQPLQKAKLNVIAQSGWSQMLDGDEQGKAVANFPWQGVYLIEVKHEDATPGERTTAAGGAEKYDVASYRTTLSLAPQATGLPALSAPPGATPKAYPPKI